MKEVKEGDYCQVLQAFIDTKEGKITCERGCIYHCPHNKSPLRDPIIRK